MSNERKISVTQCIRTIFVLVATLLMFAIIVTDPMSKNTWQIFVNTLTLWCVGDMSCHIYLECLYERES